MGPRSFERGNPPSSSTTSSSASLLQWDRAHSSAEIRLQGASDDRVVAASMGPRSFERGNALGAGLEASARRASMGPRSFERGNNLPMSGKEIMMMASMGPRSFERGNNTLCEINIDYLSSFNGAALIRARKSHLTAVRSHALMQLQWGRAHSSAEIVLKRKCSVLKKLASMGPRSFERGNTQNGAPRATRSRSFNGAALIRARKFGCASRVRLSAPELQWGRAHSSAEIWPKQRRS